jgi:hypothetical protein
MFPNAKEFLRKISAFFAGELKNSFASPVLGRKCLKNIGLKGRQTIGLPGPPTYHGLVLDKSGVSSILGKPVVP